MGDITFIKRTGPEGMLKWCAWCRGFIHEIHPYDDFRNTHGLFAQCELEHADPFAAEVVKRADLLAAIFRSLFDAGRLGDLNVASTIVDQAMEAGCSPVDVLMGMVSPMLYEIGEEWKRGALSVEAEHRFTAFAEELIELVEAKITGPSSGSNLPFASTPIFLMNAPGNRHKLALRILALWLRRRGAQVNVLPDNLDPETLKRELVLWRPRFLLISMALTEQGDQIAEITEAAQSLPSDIRPRTFVGGYPVKTGLVGSIPNAEVRADISMLEVAARMAS